MSRANPRFHRVNPTLPPLTANVVQLTIFGSIEAQLTLNILYYQDQTGTVPSIANLQAFMLAWNAANLTQLEAVSSVDWALTQLKTQYTNAPTIIPQYFLYSAATGSGTAGHEPTVVAGVLSKYSNVKGQSGRGRYYVPAIPTANVLLSNITTAHLTLEYTAYANRLAATVTAGGITYTPGIFSRRGYNKVTGAGGGFSALTSVTPRALLGTVRRRRIGRGK